MSKKTQGTKRSKMTTGSRRGICGLFFLENDHLPACSRTSSKGFHLLQVQACSGEVIKVTVRCIKMDGFIWSTLQRKLDIVITGEKLVTRKA
jgi:hypothetical protein